MSRSPGQMQLDMANENLSGPAAPNPNPFNPASVKSYGDLVKAVNDGHMTQEEGRAFGRAHNLFAAKAPANAPPADIRSVNEPADANQ